MPEDIYKKVEKYRKSMNKNRSSYVMEAVVEYTRKKEREELEEQLREAAKNTAQQYGKIKNELRDWDNAIFDYEKHYGIEKE